MTIVLVFGTFDVCHPGHEHFLKEARLHGDILKIVVARDETVQQVKGRLPRHTQEERKAVLEKLPYVDEVIIGYPDDKLKVVEEIRPDIICLGYDQISFTKDLEKRLKERGLHPKIIRLDAYYPELYKSSKLS